jgi:hypothetical protein
MKSNNRSRTPPPGVDININSLRKMNQTRQMMQCKIKHKGNVNKVAGLARTSFFPRPPCFTKLFHNERLQFRELKRQCEIRYGNNITDESNLGATRTKSLGK